MSHTGILKNKTSATEVNADYEFKIVMVGDCGVGKTSIFNRIRDGVFSSQSTIGLDHWAKYVYLENGEIVRLIIWDTAGQERFRTITKNYYRSSDAILFVFAVNDVTSFNGLMKWNDDICHMFGDDVTKLMVCNKKDLTTALHSQSVENFCEDRNFAHFFDTSALTGEGIESMLTWAAKNLVLKRDSSMEMSFTLWPRQKVSDCLC